MKTLAIRIPDQLAAELAAESQKRGISKSDVVRERLQVNRPEGKKADPLADIRHLIGVIDDDLPPDLSARTKHYLRVWGYGRKRTR